MAKNFHDSIQNKNNLKQWLVQSVTGYEQDFFKQGFLTISRK